MSVLRRIGWLALALVTLVIAAAGFLMLHPEPESGLVINRGVLSTGMTTKQDVRLPFRTQLGVDETGPVRFTAEFVAPQANADIFLLLPSHSRRMQVELNGQRLYDSSAITLWAGPMIGSPALILLPHALMRRQHNELALLLEGRDFIFSLYVPTMYVGTQAQLTPTYNVWEFFDRQLKITSLAAHLLLAFGTLFAYFYRPRDSMLAWLSAVVTGTLTIPVGLFVGFRPEFYALLPYLSVLPPAVGLLCVGSAYAVSGLRVPSPLKFLVLAVPAICILLIASGLIPRQTMPMVVSVVLFLMAMAVSTAILAWGGVIRGLTDARLLLPSYFLFISFVLRDSLLALGYLHGEIFAITPYIRPIFLLSIITVLMRRLVISLDGMDRANETLTRRLDAQQEQLVALHRAEQMEATQLARERERLRLTEDLHDGLSGHLVSIIAMSENGTQTRPIEQAARRALEDLRLVIYSLDLGDRDLALALANFRDRLEPQLRQSGVTLDWSIAALPEASGVTPSNALCVLRILQEALTNALKHGPARTVIVRGAPAPGDRIAISVENDGQPFEKGAGGFGLGNMQRRADLLGGEIEIVALPTGSRFVLFLPKCLPDIPSRA